MKTLMFTAVAALLFVSGCGNMDMFDTNFTFDTAIVKWPDGSVKTIKIRQWTDYQGEQIQIIGKDGTIYLVNSMNAVLIRKD
jgi:hypothetical protein